MDRLELVSSTTDPAFAADSKGQILAWNSAAAALFGRRESEVLGRPCWEVLAGQDLYGNDYCSPGCPLHRMALQGRAVSPCQLVFRDAAGEPTKSRVTTVAMPGRTPSDLLVVHLLSPTPSVRRNPAPGLGGPTKRARRHRLTRREQEILVCLAEGRSTRKISECLGVSRATVRNHLDHLFKKLQVHSRVEALARARQIGLVN